MALYASSSTPSGPPGRTEFEILKASHKFLREEDRDTKNLSWDEQLAYKYYASLYREFAVCDLKHYKSGSFALRWRTEDEVLSGAGEETCGNTRCEHHHTVPASPPRYSDDRHQKRKRKPKLATLELPFTYTEHREIKSALVKVVLCERCVDKLMWKRRKEKEQEAALGQSHSEGDDIVQIKNEDIDETLVIDEGHNNQKDRSKERGYRRPDAEDGYGRNRRRNSRSRSPRHTKAHPGHRPPSR